MKLKQKFTVSNLIMLITSIVLVGVISVCFLIVFIMKYPVEDMHITRAALLNPLVLNKAIGDFFQKNPETILYVLAWALLCICVALGNFNRKLNLLIRGKQRHPAYLAQINFNRVVKVHIVKGKVVKRVNVHFLKL